MSREGTEHTIRRGQNEASAQRNAATVASAWRWLAERGVPRMSSLAAALDEYELRTKESRPLDDVAF